MTDLFGCDGLVVHCARQRCLGWRRRALARHTCTEQSGSTHSHRAIASYLALGSALIIAWIRKGRIQTVNPSPLGSDVYHAAFVQTAIPSCFAALSFMCGRQTECHTHASLLVFACHRCTASWSCVIF